MSLLWSYPREATGLGAAEFQAAPLQRSLPCCEAAQGAAAVLQDVWQLGLQPFDGGSCHGRRAHSSRFRGAQVLSPPPSKDSLTLRAAHTLLYTIRHTKTHNCLAADWTDGYSLTSCPRPKKCNLTPPTSGVSGYSGPADRKHPPPLIG